jgi:hypothetical protein
LHAAHKSEVSISVAIMHASFDGRRKKYLDSLLRQLFDGADDVPKKTSAFTVIRDNDGIGPWRVAKTAWAWSLRSGATHHILLQDDVEVSKDFLVAAKQIADANGNVPVSFYADTEEIWKARDMHVPWIVSHSIHVNGPALMLPTDLVAEFLRWEKGKFKDTKKEDDERIGAWAYLTENYFWFTAPSLAEHVGSQESTLKHDGASTATSFIGREQSPVDIDWTKPKDPPTSRRIYPTWFKRMLVKQQT